MPLALIIDDGFFSSRIFGTCPRIWITLLMLMLVDMESFDTLLGASLVPLPGSGASRSENSFHQRE